MFREVLVFSDSIFKTVEVEVVFDEVIVDFAEEVMIFQSAEPLNPAHVDVLAEL